MRAVLSGFWVIGLFAGLSLAQESDHSMAGHDDSSHDMQSMPGMDMSAPAPDWMPSMHAGSGTAWEPASVPGHMRMSSRGGWDLMAHGVVFLTYNQQGGPRGAGKAESVNWLMFMEQHKLGKGTLLFREMFSAESLTSPHPGFPQIFQTGETYHGAPLVDHQHPHNVFAEPRRNELPLPAQLKAGDWMLVYQRRGVQFDPANGRLRWDGGAPVSAQLKLRGEGAALFLIQ